MLSNADGERFEDNCLPFSIDFNLLYIVYRFLVYRFLTYIYSIHLYIYVSFYVCIYIYIYIYSIKMKIIWQKIKLYYIRCHLY